MAANPSHALMPAKLNAQLAKLPKAKAGPLSKLRLGWISNGLRTPTGYGNQTTLFAPRMHAQMEHLFILANYGLQGRSEVDPQTGILQIPSFRDTWMNDISLQHAHEQGAHALIALVDIFVLNSDVFNQIYSVAYSPLDCEGIPAGHLKSLKGFQRHWAMSRFAERHYVAQYGADNVDYVPHGVDTKAYRPSNRDEARKKLGPYWGTDLNGKMLIVTVAANKGTPSRKNFAAMMRAVDELHQKNKDVVWYVHTDPTGSIGDNLHEMAKTMGVSVPIIYPNIVRYGSGGFQEDYLNDVYNAADAKLLLSYGEGFGIPIVEAQAAGCPVVVTDGSAMSELVFGGFAVKSHRIQAIQGRMGCFWHLADHDAALEALQTIHDEMGTDAAIDRRNNARIGALAYDVDTVYKKWWVPALEKVAEDVGVNENWPHVGLMKRSADGTRWFIKPSTNPKSDKALMISGLRRKVIDGWGMTCCDVTLDLEDDETSGVAKVVLHEIEHDYKLQDIEFAAGDVVIDVGAQVGAVSCWLGKRHPDIHVYAFEPNPASFTRLTRNIKANGLENVTAVNKAVTKDGRNVDIYCDPRNIGGANVYGFQDSQPTAQAESITFAQVRQMIVDDGRGKAIKLLKLDCEGAEYEIAADPLALTDIAILRGEFHSNNLLLRKVQPSIETFRKLIPDFRVSTIPVDDVTLADPTPDVSIIIPTYNGAGTIQRAIDAALNLKGITCEVVVIDDGSTDGTAELLQQRYVDTSTPGVRVIMHPVNRGQVAAMNTAIEKATADYILFHGDDDWVGEGVIALVRALDGHPELAFAYGPQAYHGLRNDTVQPPPFNAAQLWRNYYMLNGVIYRRSLFTDEGLKWRKLHGLDGVGACEDYDFALQVIDKGHKGVLIRDIPPVLHYTLARGRATTTKEQHVGEVLAAFRAEWGDKFTAKVV